MREFCSVEECDKKVMIRSARMCSAHYQAARRSGTLVPAFRWVNDDGIRMECSQDGCDAPVGSRGLCNPHYRKALRGDSPKKDFIQSKWVNPDGSRKTCQVGECGKPILCSGMCGSHYHRFRRRGSMGVSIEAPDVRAPRSKWIHPDGTRMTCAVPQCDRPITSRGLCSPHYSKDRTHRMKEATSLCPVDSCGRPRLASATLCFKCRQARWRYGLSDEGFIFMNRPENRHCDNQGCLSPDNLHIDHDHRCSHLGDTPAKDRVCCGDCVRGWLCRSCNTSLGLLAEDPRRIEGLLAYLSGAKR